jgi:hypothetical protein
MPKRFTDTAKFSDPWYRKLPPEYKLLWEYMYCLCDGAGVIDLDIDHAEFCIGKELDMAKLLELFGEDRIKKLPSGKLYLVKFIRFQYGPNLRTGCKPHKSVIDLVEKYGLVKDLEKGLVTVQRTVQDKIRKDKTRKPQHAGGSPNTEEEIRAGLAARGLMIDD